jgi:hypothetical protein
LDNTEEIRKIKNKIKSIRKKSRNRGEIYDDVLLIPAIQEWLLNNGVSKEFLYDVISKYEEKEGDVDGTL